MIIEYSMGCKQDACRTALFVRPRENQKSNFSTPIHPHSFIHSFIHPSNSSDSFTLVLPAGINPISTHRLYTEIDGAP